jgi:hypothetical protein
MARMELTDTDVADLLRAARAEGRAGARWEQGVPGVRHDAPGAAGGGGAWALRLEGGTAYCRDCYMEAGDAQGGRLEEELSAGLSGSSTAWLYAALNTETGGLALEADYGSGPAFPAAPSPVVRHLIYRLEKGTSGKWRLGTDYRAAPRSAVFRRW